MKFKDFVFNGFIAAGVSLIHQSIVYPGGLVIFIFVKPGVERTFIRIKSALSLVEFSQEALAYEQGEMGHHGPDK